MNQSIALIGLSGSGKSTVARLLAAHLGWSCADTDPLIEQLAGTSIPELFRQYGEAYFRDLETQVLRETLAAGGLQVLATGGGIVLRDENRELLRKSAYVVWLDAPVALLVARLARHHEQRPLLAGDDPAARLEQLRKQRAPLYAATAHLHLDTSQLDPNAVAAQMIAALFS